MTLVEFVNKYKDYCDEHFESGYCELKSDLPEYRECDPKRCPSCLPTIMNSPEYAEKVIHDWTIKESERNSSSDLGEKAIHDWMMKESKRDSDKELGEKAIHDWMMKESERVPDNDNEDLELAVKQSHQHPDDKTNSEIVSDFLKDHKSNDKNENSKPRSQIISEWLDHEKRKIKNIKNSGPKSKVTQDWLNHKRHKYDKGE